MLKHPLQRRFLRLDGTPYASFSASKHFFNRLLAPFLPARIETRLRFRGGSPGRFAVYLQTPAAPPGQRSERQFLQQAEGNEEGVALHAEVVPGPKVVFTLGVDH
ncbi:MAG: hypothetical protein IPN34_20530 [Planctomycetes bacterium]|nr:hypothetical protein [Planctomycetota bacterium]